MKNDKLKLVLKENISVLCTNVSGSLKSFSSIEPYKQNAQQDIKQYLYETYFGLKDAMHAFLMLISILCLAIAVYRVYGRSRIAAFGLSLAIVSIILLVILLCIKISANIKSRRFGDDLYIVPCLVRVSLRESSYCVNATCLNEDSTIVFSFKGVSGDGWQNKENRSCYIIIYKDWAFCINMKLLDIACT